MRMRLFFIAMILLLMFGGGGSIAAGREGKWVPLKTGDPNPGPLIQIQRDQFVCRAKISDQYLHPGRLVDGKCYVAVANHKEDAFSEYEVVINEGGRWGGGAEGTDRALIGGWSVETNQPKENIYVCRVHYWEPSTYVWPLSLIGFHTDRGWQGGKLSRDTQDDRKGVCIFGYKGERITDSTYDLFFP